jgi:hypothetical protein
MTSPIIAIMIPTRNSTPPKATNTISFTHAKMCPERIVAKQDDMERNVSNGPTMSIPIPIRNTGKRNGGMLSE